jgi:phage antirepressor YoqD-like protein/predicted transcriptional regulator
MTTLPAPARLAAREPATMSSRDIADLCETRHNQVVETIERLFAKGVLRESRKTTRAHRPEGGGRPTEVYDLTKRDTLVVVSGYNDELRARIIDRWEDLERRAGLTLPDLSDPDTLRGLLANYADDKAALQNRLAIAAPKAAALERLAEADGSLCITDAAKALQVQPKALFSYLRSEGWIYRRTGSDHDVSYQSKLQAGYLEHKVKRLPRPSGPDKITEQVRVTPKGLARLAALLEAARGGE